MLFSQNQGAKTPSAPAALPLPKKKKTSSLAIPFNPDSYVTTEHVTTIKGQKVPFQAMTGTMPVWDEEGKAIAGLFLYLLRTYRC